jgi:hypothetical protein
MTCEERVPMRIALFVTCLTHTLFPATGQAAVTLPERLGHQVEFPEGQTCCGQMHFNSGYRRPPHPAHPGGGLTRGRPVSEISASQWRGCPAGSPFGGRPGVIYSGTGSSGCPRVRGQGCKLTGGTSPDRRLVFPARCRGSAGIEEGLLCPVSHVRFPAAQVFAT